MSPTSNTTMEQTNQTQTPKKIRSQDPDVTVVVGSGDNQKNYQCYKVLLCYSSPYLDTMLSSGMLESSENLIKLPDKKPEEWELVYSFMDINTVRDAKITKENVEILCPWFHEFQMDALLDECDKFISKEFSDSCKKMKLTALFQNKRQRKLHKKVVLSYLDKSSHWNLCLTKRTVLSKLNSMLSDDTYILELEDIVQLKPYLKETGEDMKFLRDIFSKFLPNSMLLTDDNISSIIDHVSFEHLVFAEIKVQRAQLAMNLAVKEFPKRLSSRLPSKSINENGEKTNQAVLKLMKGAIYYYWKDSGIEIPADWKEYDDLVYFSGWR